jgi:hypothetical protein
MKWLKKYSLFKESKDTTKVKKNVVRDICVSMLLINNEFLDSILDKGLRARYQENSHVFVTDLKNLLLAKNRLKLGKFDGDRCIEDDEYSKINPIFDSLDFNMEEDWKILEGARTSARSIIDKFLPDEKLTPDKIKNIYWNLSEGDNDEDIVIELQDDSQYSFFLNKNLSAQKTASFSLFADDLIGADIDKLYKDEYLPKWDKLVQQWIKIIYENANKNIQQHIEKFIDPKRIDNMGYFEYFDIRHRDPRYKNLGEFMREFDKNILKFPELMNEIWKNKEECFMDLERVEKEWYEIKIVILNSKILEHLLTTSLQANHIEDVTKVEDGLKLAKGTVKMKLFKTLVEKLGCLERPVYFLGNKGDMFNLVPSRTFFREFYDDISIKFDYHVKFKVDTEEENNDFKMKIIFELDGEKLVDMDIHVKFSGGEMSGKLSSKYKFDISPNFNYLISKKEMGNPE